MRKTSLNKSGLQFKIGIVLLILSFPVAYGLIFLFGILSIKTANSKWLWWSGKVYAISWVLLGFSVLLIGKQGVSWFKKQMKMLFQNKNIR